MVVYNILRTNANINPKQLIKLPTYINFKQLSAESSSIQFVPPEKTPDWAILSLTINIKPQQKHIANYWERVRASGAWIETEP